LRSKSWDTRVAAAQAIGAIAENVPHVTVREVLAKAEAALAKDGVPTSLLEALVTSQEAGSESSTSLAFHRYVYNLIVVP
jgi:TATA-binding protein-associated factor